MTIQNVSSYTSTMSFDGTQKKQTITLWSSTNQPPYWSFPVGEISFTDPLHFHVTIEMLRNEGPNVIWDSGKKRLQFGKEPIGEGERK